LDRLKPIVIFLLIAFSASCATVLQGEPGAEKDLSVTRDWQDWREPPPWSRR